MASPTSPEPAPRSVNCDYILLALPIDVSLVSIEKVYEYRSPKRVELSSNLPIFGPKADGKLPEETNPLRG